MPRPSVSIILPALNEASSITELIREIKRLHPDAEVIVVNDGSQDNTSEAAAAAGATVINHPYRCGNGAAIKSGARQAQGEILVFLDGDGQHDPADISQLLTRMDDGYDLAIGARQGRADQANWARWCGNLAYNRLAALLVGHPVDDLTSGFRAVRRTLFLSILDLLPNGFSYPTTSTMAFFRAGHRVVFVPISVRERTANTNSHIRLLHDGARFFTIIFRVATLYSPLKVFVPVAALLFLSGGAYYAYTFLTEGRFTNMGVLLLVSSIFVFLIGLLSEQITTLIYMNLRHTSPALAGTPPKHQTGDVTAPACDPQPSDPGNAART